MYFTFLLRITPVETLHTILLGCCKYVLKSFMTGKSSHEKREILARVRSFDQSSFSVKVTL